MIAKHILDAEFFNSDNAVLVDKPPCRLVNKVMTTVTNPLMDTGKNLVDFLSRRTSLLGFGLFSASLRQCFFITAKEARIVNELAIGQRHKRVQSRVKADGFSR